MKIKTKEIGRVIEKNANAASEVTTANRNNILETILITNKEKERQKLEKIINKQFDIGIKKGLL